VFRLLSFCFLLIRYQVELSSVIRDNRRAGHRLCLSYVNSQSYGHMDTYSPNSVVRGLRQNSVHERNSEKIENNRFCRLSVGAKALKQIVMSVHIVYHIRMRDIERGVWGFFPFANSLFVWQYLLQSFCSYTF